MKKSITVLFLLLFAVCGATIISSCGSVPKAAAPESDFKVTIANGAVTITEYMGNGGSVVIPATMMGGLPVTGIGAAVFYRNTGLTSVSIPASVTSIGNFAFNGCTGLAGVSVDPRNPSYTSRKGVLFNKAGDTLIAYPAGKKGPYAIPAGVTSIGNNAFGGCTGLASVSIPSSVTIIGESAFANCTGLTSVSIPASVYNIMVFAFNGCTSLTSVSIGANVTVATSDAGVAFENGFRDYYDTNGKKAGVYTFRNGAWSYSPQ